MSQIHSNTPPLHHFIPDLDTIQLLNNHLLFPTLTTTAATTTTTINPTLIHDSNNNVKPTTVNHIHDDSLNEPLLTNPLTIFSTLQSHFALLDGTNTPLPSLFTSSQIVIPTLLTIVNNLSHQLDYCGQPFLIAWYHLLTEYYNDFVTHYNTFLLSNNHIQTTTNTNNDNDVVQIIHSITTTITQILRLFESTIQDLVQLTHILSVLNHDSSSSSSHSSSSSCLSGPSSNNDSHVTLYYYNYALMLLTTLHTSLFQQLITQITTLSTSLRSTHLSQDTHAIYSSLPETASKDSYFRLYNIFLGFLPISFTIQEYVIYITRLYFIPYNVSYLTTIHSTMSTSPSNSSTPSSSIPLSDKFHNINISSIWGTLCSIMTQNKSNTIMTTHSPHHINNNDDQLDYTPLILDYFKTIYEYYNYKFGKLYDAQRGIASSGNGGLELNHSYCHDRVLSPPNNKSFSKSAESKVFGKNLPLSNLKGDNNQYNAPFYYNQLHSHLNHDDILLNCNTFTIKLLLFATQLATSTSSQLRSIELIQQVIDNYHKLVSPLSDNTHDSNSYMIRAIYQNINLSSVVQYIWSTQLQFIMNVQRYQSLLSSNTTNIINPKVLQYKHGITITKLSTTSIISSNYSNTVATGIHQNSSDSINTLPLFLPISHKNYVIKRFNNSKINEHELGDNVSNQLFLFFTHNALIYDDWVIDQLYYTQLMKAKYIFIDITRQQDEQKTGMNKDSNQTNVALDLNITTYLKYQISQYAQLLPLLHYINYLYIPITLLHNYNNLNTTYKIPNPILVPYNLISSYQLSSTPMASHSQQLTVNAHYTPSSLSFLYNPIVIYYNKMISSLQNELYFIVLNGAKNTFMSFKYHQDGNHHDMGSTNGAIQQTNSQDQAFMKGSLNNHSDDHTAAHFQYNADRPAKAHQIVDCKHNAEDDYSLLSALMEDEEDKDGGNIATMDQINQVMMTDRDYPNNNQVNNVNESGIHRYVHPHDRDGSKEQSTRPKSPTITPTQILPWCVCATIGSTNDIPIANLCTHTPKCACICMCLTSIDMMSLLDYNNIPSTGDTDLSFHQYVAHHPTHYSAYLKPELDLCESSSDYGITEQQLFTLYSKLDQHQKAQNGKYSMQSRGGDDCEGYRIYNNFISTFSIINNDTISTINSNSPEIVAYLTKKFCHTSQTPFSSYLALKNNHYNLEQQYLLPLSILKTFFNNHNTPDFKQDYSQPNKFKQRQYQLYIIYQHTINVIDLINTEFNMLLQCYCVNSFNEIFGIHHFNPTSNSVDNSHKTDSPNSSGFSVMDNTTLYQFSTQNMYQNMMRKISHHNGPLEKDILSLYLLLTSSLTHIDVMSFGCHPLPQCNHSLGGVSRLPHLLTGCVVISPTTIKFPTSLQYHQISQQPDNSSSRMISNHNASPRIHQGIQNIVSIYPNFYTLPHSFNIFLHQYYIVYTIQYIVRIVPITLVLEHCFNIGNTQLASSNASPKRNYSPQATTFYSKFLAYQKNYGKIQRHPDDIMSVLDDYDNASQTQMNTSKAGKKNQEHNNIIWDYVNITLVDLIESSLNDNSEFSSSPKTDIFHSDILKLDAILQTYTTSRQPLRNSKMNPQKNLNHNIQFYSEQHMTTYTTVNGVIDDILNYIITPLSTHYTSSFISSSGNQNILLLNNVLAYHTFIIEPVVYLLVYYFKYYTTLLSSKVQTICDEFLTELVVSRTDLVSSITNQQSNPQHYNEIINNIYTIFHFVELYNNVIKHFKLSLYKIYANSGASGANNIISSMLRYAHYLNRQHQYWETYHTFINSLTPLPSSQSTDNRDLNSLLYSMKTLYHQYNVLINDNIPIEQNNDKGERGKEHINIPISNLPQHLIDAPPSPTTYIISHPTIFTVNHSLQTTLTTLLGDEQRWLQVVLLKEILSTILSMIVMESSLSLYTDNESTPNYVDFNTIKQLYITLKLQLISITNSHSIPLYARTAHNSSSSSCDYINKIDDFMMHGFDYTEIIKNDLIFNKMNCHSLNVYYANFSHYTHHISSKQCENGNSSMKLIDYYSIINNINESNLSHQTNTTQPSYVLLPNGIIVNATTASPYLPLGLIYNLFSITCDSDLKKCEKNLISLSSTRTALNISSDFMLQFPELSDVLTSIINKTSPTPKTLFLNDVLSHILISPQSRYYSASDIMLIIKQLLQYIILITTLPQYGKSDPLHYTSLLTTYHNNNIVIQHNVVLQLVLLDMKIISDYILNKANYSSLMAITKNNSWKQQYNDLSNLIISEISYQSTVLFSLLKTMLNFNRIYYNPITISKHLSTRKNSSNCYNEIINNICHNIDTLLYDIVISNIVPTYHNYSAQKQEHIKQCKRVSKNFDLRSAGDMKDDEDLKFIESYINRCYLIFNFTLLLALSIQDVIAKNQSVPLYQSETSQPLLSPFNNAISHHLMYYQQRWYLELVQSDEMTEAISYKTINSTLVHSTHSDLPPVSNNIELLRFSQSCLNKDMMNQPNDSIPSFLIFTLPVVHKFIINVIQQVYIIDKDQDPLSKSYIYYSSLINNFPKLTSSFILLFLLTSPQQINILNSIESLLLLSNEMCGLGHDAVLFGSFSTPQAEFTKVGIPSQHSSMQLSSQAIEDITSLLSMKKEDSVFSQQLTAAKLLYTLQFSCNITGMTIEQIKFILTGEK